MIIAVADPEDESTTPSDTDFETEHQSLYGEDSMTSEAARDLLEKEWDNAIA